MKRNCILMALTFLTTGNIWGEEIPKDTIKVVDVEEILIIASPKENRKLRELPTASTLLSQQDMQANQVTNLKGLSTLVPNIFIPDYGSKLTSAIYIRGIGSRINTPSVGLYVDNVPYIDKSAFDFNYSDIERIDVLRGPQGTLYGRNTMGGLIKVHTKSPFSYQGTDLRLSAGTYEITMHRLPIIIGCRNNSLFLPEVSMNMQTDFSRMQPKTIKRPTVSMPAAGVSVPSICQQRI